MIAAVILAAGASSRMGEFKPLLPLAGKPVIEYGVRCFRQAGIRDIVVVAGHRAAELIPVLERLKIRWVVNEHIDSGMLSSVRLGIQALPRTVDAFFLLPADIPLVRSRSLRCLVKTYRSAPATVLYPVFDGKRGHPPLLSAGLIPEIAAADDTGGLRQILHSHDTESRELSLIDESILLDMDRPEDYERITLRQRQRYIPTAAECEALFRLAATDTAAIRHGRAVALVGRKLVLALNEAGGQYDADLIAAAGLLHDLAKGSTDHARAGSRLLRRLGFIRLARIVASHMDLLFNEALLDEAAILFLTDKVICHETFVPLEQRLSQTAGRFAGEETILALVRRRFATAQQIQQAVERILGKPLDVILGYQDETAAGGKSDESC